mgnify:CR=1 FL=1
MTQGDFHNDSDVRPHAVDPLLPPEMAIKAEYIGAAKARLDSISLLALAVLAGAFIALGALFSTVVVTGAGDLSFGVVRLLAGLVFSLGLILVVIGGAELFTGNNLMVMAAAARKITWGEMLRAWGIVYLGNLIGAVGTAALVYLGGQYLMAGGGVGETALAIAEAKANLTFQRAFFLGVLCNVLVCLAIWLSYSAHTVSGKILCIVPPITAFVAAGFEHSIANMYFFAIALMIRGGDSSGFWAAIGWTPYDYASVDLAGAFMNLLPVTLGNMVGGGLLVGGVYWFVYLRRR